MSLMQIEAEIAKLTPEEIQHLQQSLAEELARKSAEPINMAEMFRIAEACAVGTDFLRVDFYEVDGRLWFGEYCLYPGSGLDPFVPDSLDLLLGKYWSDARI